MGTLIKIKHSGSLELEPTHFIKMKLLMPFPLRSPEDKRFSLQLIQSVGEGENSLGLLRTKNHGIYPGVYFRIQNAYI